MKPKVQPLGAAIARERRDGGQVKLSTFIPLKIRKRGASKVVVRPDGAVESPGKIATGAITSAAHCIAISSSFPKRVRMASRSFSRISGLYSSAAFFEFRLKTFATRSEITCGEVSKWRNFAQEATTFSGEAIRSCMSSVCSLSSRSSASAIAYHSICAYQAITQASRK